MLKEKFYPKVSSILNSWADGLNRKGVTPNQLTLFGGALSLLTGMLFAKSSLIGGALVMLAAGVCDALDGPLARLSGKESKFGAFLDSTMDRLSDGFILAGLALHFYNEDDSFWIAVCLGLMIFSFVISYAKARAENFIENCSLGLFTRETRYVAILLAALMPELLLKPILLITLFGSGWTVYQRIDFVKQKLEITKPSTNDSSAAV